MTQTISEVRQLLKNMGLSIRVTRMGGRGDFCFETPRPGREFPEMNFVKGEITEAVIMDLLGFKPVKA